MKLFKASILRVILMWKFSQKTSLSLTDGKSILPLRFSSNSSLQIWDSALAGSAAANSSVPLDSTPEPSQALGSKWKNPGGCFFVTKRKTWLPWKDSSHQKWFPFATCFFQMKTQFLSSMRKSDHERGGEAPASCAWTLVDGVGWEVGGNWVYLFWSANNHSEPPLAEL